MYCANCGKEVDPNANVCLNCGVFINTTKHAANPLAKSKMAAGLLGIFLGGFGIHNFYLGYNGKAIIQICLTVLSCGILSFVSVVWGIVEGILILTGEISCDAAGIPLKE